jgi:hypothetical protein
MDSRIPKRIIQTGKSVDLPMLQKAAAANVRLLNPDFEYLFFDNAQVDDFVDEQFPQYRNVFDSFRFPIQRYDFFRYLAVYRFGGFYFDLDVFLMSGLEKLLEFSCVFPFEELTINMFLRREYGMDWEIGNYAFGASPGHPFLKKIIDNCVKAQKDVKWADEMIRCIPLMFRSRYRVLYTTGPGLVSRTLAEYQPDADEVRVLFPEDVLERKNWYQFGDLGIHLMRGTWSEQEGTLTRVLGRRWIAHTRKKLFVESLKLGKKRSVEMIQNDSSS